MNVKRRHLLQNSIYAAVGFGLARLGVTPAHARLSLSSIASNDLRAGKFGLIPAQLSQRFFEGVFYADRSLKERYDRFVANGFKFTPDALVGLNLVDPSTEPFLFVTLTGKKAAASADLTDFAVISAIYTKKTIFDLGASSSTFSAKNSQLQAITLYLPGADKSVELQLDRQFLLAGTATELADRIRTLLVRAARPNRANDSPPTIDLVYPGLKTSGLSRAQFVTAIGLVEQQIGREDFLTPTQDRYLYQKLNLALTQQAKEFRGASPVVFITLPLTIELASTANLIGNARRLDSDPVIMPRQSEIPEPSYREPSAR